MKRATIGLMGAIAPFLLGAAAPRPPHPHWLAAYVSPQMLAPAKPDPGDDTVRQIIRFEAAGTKVRLFVGNEGGKAPLRAQDMSIALLDSHGRIRPDTVRPVTFGTARDGVTLRLSYRPPYDWPGMLDALGARSAKRLEWVEGGVWHRRIELDGNTGTVAVSHLPERNAVAVTIRFPEVRALPAIVAATAGKIPVLLDSGVRGGADIFKALALGATAVCIGRPYVYGLALAGADGVHDVLRNLMADFELTMALAGCKKVQEIDRHCLALPTFLP